MCNEFIFGLVIIERSIMHTNKNPPMKCHGSMSTNCSHYQSNYSALYISRKGTMRGLQLYIFWICILVCLIAKKN